MPVFAYFMEKRMRFMWWTFIARVFIGKGVILVTNTLMDHHCGKDLAFAFCS